MALPTINTREDLDAIQGTPEHAAYMAMLAGTLWHLERDDEHQTWVVVEDNTVIERFGFTRADFPNAQPPELPAYEKAPGPQVVSMRQGRLALLGAGLLDTIDGAIAAIEDPVQRRAAQIEWEYAQTIDRNSAFTQTMAAGLGLTDEQMDQLFLAASQL